jgi:hypothetical protein
MLRIFSPEKSDGSGRIRNEYQAYKLEVKAVGV